MSEVKRDQLRLLIASDTFPLILRKNAKHLEENEERLLGYIQRTSELDMAVNTYIYHTFTSANNSLNPKVDQIENIFHIETTSD
jgi:hypothetical protein